MLWFKPHFKVEVSKDTLHGGFMFYVWLGCQIKASGYNFSTASEAANAGMSAKNDLIEAWKITKGK